MSKKQNPKPAVAKPVTRASSLKQQKIQTARSFADIEKESKDRFSKAVNDYWNFVSNPFDNPPARPVFYDGRYIGNTGIVVGRRKGSFYAGTNGVGYISATLARGPTSKAIDAPIYVTDNTYAGTVATAYNAATAGVVGMPLNDVVYDSTENNIELIWRPIAGALRIFPIGSMTSQDGVISMIEIPGHVNLFGTTTFTGGTPQALRANPRTRVVRGAQLGDQSIVNQLNWHPQGANFAAVTNAGYANSFVSDTDFRGFNSANTSGQIGELIIGVEATAGLLFEFEFIAAWETKGSKASGLRPSIQDAHASAIIFNTLCRQIVSGMIGKPHEFTQNYHAALLHSAKKTVSHAKDWMTIGKDVAGIVKEVAGFVL